MAGQKILSVLFIALFVTFAAAARLLDEEDTVPAITTPGSASTSVSGPFPGPLPASGSGSAGTGSGFAGTGSGSAGTGFGAGTGSIPSRGSGPTATGLGAGKGSIQSSGSGLGPLPTAGSVPGPLPVGGPGSLPATGPLPAAGSGNIPAGGSATGRGVSAGPALGGGAGAGPALGGGVSAGQALGGGAGAGQALGGGVGAGQALGGGAGAGPALGGGAGAGPALGGGAGAGPALGGGAGAGPALGGGVGADHPLVFFMHDILGGSNPTARAVTGVVANPAVSGQLPFAKPNGANLPINNGVPSNNNNVGITNNNNIPLLVGLGGTTANIIQENGNGNGLSAANGGQLPTGSALQMLMFGTMTVIDDELTEGHELGSGMVGKAQGYYVASAVDGTSQTMAFTAMFESGGYEDSISFFGVHRTAVSESHLGVMGGTGKYVNARGFAVVKTFTGSTGNQNQDQPHRFTDGFETVLQCTVYLSY